MSEFKGTKGEPTTAKEFELNVIGEEGSEFMAIPIYSHHRNIVLIPTDFGQIEAEANANIIVDALKVRQQINCELSELLEQRNEMLKYLQKIVQCFEEDCLSEFSINKARELIKKVKENE